MTHTTLTLLELICRLIRAGWSVEYSPRANLYQWRRPNGDTGYQYCSRELMNLPYEVLLDFCLSSTP